VVSNSLAAVDPKYDPAKDARVVAADDRWITCMTRHGYDAARSLGASGLVNKRFAATAGAVVQAWDPASGEFPALSDAERRDLLDYEIQVAESDDACDVEVGLAGLGGTTRPNVEVGLSVARSTATAEIAARLREQYPDVVIEPYDPNMR
jgi:hypothetical protein